MGHEDVRGRKDEAGRDGRFLDVAGRDGMMGGLIKVSQFIGRFLRPDGAAVGLKGMGEVRPERLQVVTVVNQTYDAAARPVVNGVTRQEHFTDASADLGSTCLVEVLTENLGTGYDNVTLAAGGPSAYWKCTFVSLSGGGDAVPTNVSAGSGTPLRLPSNGSAFMYRLEGDGGALDSVVVGLDPGSAVIATVGVKVPPTRPCPHRSCSTSA